MRCLFMLFSLLSLSDMRFKVYIFIQHYNTLFVLSIFCPNCCFDFFCLLNNCTVCQTFPLFFRLLSHVSLAFSLLLLQINELSNVPVPVMLMPDDFKAYSKIKVDNHLFNKQVLSVQSVKGPMCCSSVNKQKGLKHLLPKITDWITFHLCSNSPIMYVC